MKKQNKRNSFPSQLRPFICLDITISSARCSNIARAQPKAMRSNYSVYYLRPGHEQFCKVLPDDTSLLIDSTNLLTIEYWFIPLSLDFRFMCFYDTFRTSHSWKNITLLCYNQERIKIEPTSISTLKKSCCRIKIKHMLGQIWLCYWNGSSDVFANVLMC